MNWSKLILPDLHQIWHLKHELPRISRHTTDVIRYYFQPPCASLQPPHMLRTSLHDRPQCTFPCSMKSFACYPAKSYGRGMATKGQHISHRILVMQPGKLSLTWRKKNRAVCRMTERNIVGNMSDGLMPWRKSYTFHPGGYRQEREAAPASVSRWETKSHARRAHSNTPPDFAGRPRRSSSEERLPRTFNW